METIPLNPTAFDRLLAEVRACRVCANLLPLGPRPVLRATLTPRVLIIGQAPGTRVHETGIPWNDASGKRLRQWLDMDDQLFYDEGRIAIIPAGLCYPGANPKGGDMPPRPECAPLWLARLRAALVNVELTLLVGAHAQAACLDGRRKRTMTETVRNFRDYLPAYLPTPHPSWRTMRWQAQNPWFENDVLPELRRRIHGLINGTGVP